MTASNIIVLIIIFFQVMVKIRAEKVTAYILSFDRMVIIITMHVYTDLNEVLTASDAGAEAAAIPQTPGGMIVAPTT